MLHLIKAPENGARPYLLVRTTPSRGAHEAPGMAMLGAFSRDEVVELGAAITDALASE